MSTSAGSLYAPPDGSAVLFLDVDGVLNCAGTKERNPHGAVGVDPTKAEMVRRILRDTGCQLVISSTWRRDRDLVHHLWGQIGAEWKDRWAGNTPILDTRLASGLYATVVRGDEIQAWLDNNPHVTRFVILDDDADMKHLAPHLLRTHGCEGLTDEITAEAIRRLNTVVRGAALGPRTSPPTGSETL